MIEFRSFAGWTALLFICQLIIDVIWISVHCILLNIACELCTDYFSRMFLISIILSSIGLVMYFSFCLVKHYMWDKDSILKINVENQEFKYHRGDDCRIFYGEDVKEVRFRGRIVQRIHMMKWVHLTLKDDTSIYITWFLKDAPDYIFTYQKELGLPEPMSEYSEGILEGYIPK